MGTRRGFVQVLNISIDRLLNRTFGVSYCLLYPRASGKDRKTLRVITSLKNVWERSVGETGSLGGES